MRVVCGKGCKAGGVHCATSSTGRVRCWFISNGRHGCYWVHKGLQMGVRGRGGVVCEYREYREYREFVIL